jgi:hypothetical protein
MESNHSKSYSNPNSYCPPDSLYYGSLNKRDAKAVQKSQSFSLGNDSYESSTRWKTPISRPEINLFYSQYKDFIEAAEDYQQKNRKESQPPAFKKDSSQISNFTLKTNQRDTVPKPPAEPDRPLR